MIKKILSAYLPYFFSLGLMIFCSSTIIKAENFVFDDCNVPAPDSFRVVEKGTNFISLKWHPTFSGATYCLKAYEKNEAGILELLFVAPTISRTEHIAEGLESGREYKFEIFTNCNAGGTGIQSRSIFDGTLILELTVEGRTPINPVQVDCYNIPYKDFEWTGFRIDQLSRDGAIISSNMFEFNFCGDPTTNPNSTICIKRVALESPIVATNESGSWPLLPGDIIGTQSPFRMAFQPGMGPNNTQSIGRVIVAASPTSVKLCSDLTNINDPWLLNYSFKAIVSNEVVQFNEKDTDRAVKKPSLKNQIFVETPFKESIEIFFPEGGYFQTAKFRLVNSLGQVLLNQQVYDVHSSVHMSIPPLPTGIYVLEVEADDKFYRIKTTH